MSKILRSADATAATPVLISAGSPVRAAVEHPVAREPVVSPEKLADAQRVAAEQQQARRASELAQLQKDAEERGYAEGLQRATREQRAAMSTKLKRLDELSASLETQRASLRDELEDAVVEITLAALVRLLGEARNTAAQVREMTIRSIERAGYLKEPLVVKLAPEDYELLIKEAAQSEPSVDLASVKWEPDARISLGGCILESPRGHLDLRTETRLERFKDALLDIRRRAE